MWEKLLKGTNMLTELIKRYQAYLKNAAHTEYNKKLFAMLEKSSHGCILLDCGCSDGEKTLKAAKYVGATKACGIDVDDEALSKARSKGIVTYRADLNERFPLDDESVDVVYSNMVIEHLTNPLNFVREIYRVLTPNGYSAIGTENLASWVNIFALVLGWQPFSSKIGLGNPLIFVGKEDRTKIRCIPAEHAFWCGYGYGTHNKVLAYRGLKEIFEMNGFKVEKICGTGYYPFPGIVGRFLSNIDCRHTFYLILMARKPREKS